MKIEQQLKEMIMERFGSVAEFTAYAGIPNSSFVSIINRGINTANMSNMIKISHALNISIDEIARGQIAPVASNSPYFGGDISSSLNLYKHGLKGLDTLEVDGITLSDDERRMFYAMLDGVVDVLRQLKK